MKDLSNESIIPEATVKQIVDPKLFKSCGDRYLPFDKNFCANLTPFQEISDCFNEGTTPNFGTHIYRFIGENNYVRSCKWYLFEFYNGDHSNFEEAVPLATSSE